MANPLTTTRNKYYQNKKNSSIFTPKGVCDFLFDILKNYINDYLDWDDKIIIDPAIGIGNLLAPFKNFYKDKITTIGYDIKNYPNRKYTDVFVKLDFLSIESMYESTITFITPPVEDFIIVYDKDSPSGSLYLNEKIKSNDNIFPTENISLVICNPPFNNDTVSKYNKKLLPELFAKKVFELYGYDIPLVLFAPMGFRLNNRKISKRREYFSNSCKAKITSIISLPLDIFPDVEFHNEILIWNIPNLEAHYWLPNIYLK